MNNQNEKMGIIQSVDTNTVIITIEEEEILNNLQVNQLLKIKSTNSGESIIALVSKIMRKAVNVIDGNSEEVIVEDVVKAHLIGTWHDAVGNEKNVFTRSLKVVPSIDAQSFVLEEEELKEFMGAVSSSKEDNLVLGKYTIQEETSALLNGNKFFQRHAVIVGGTGSGKSWTVANILEKASELSSVNNIVFDLHGEYENLAELPNTTNLKIAGPADKKDQDHIIFLPYWLFTYEEIAAMLLDRSEQNAPNQARALFDAIIELKRKKLDEYIPREKAVLDNFTIDSPIPYDINEILETLGDLDIQMIEGSSGRQKQDPLHYGQYTRFIQRLSSKVSDKRLNFLFNQDESLQKFDWLENLALKLMAFDKDTSGSKIIDFSEVPSDILPLITGLVARLIFSIQQWTDKVNRHPIALFCDEAHLYIPRHVNDSINAKGLHNFERIAKEGRKYGVSLVVISQRPSDVSNTVLSQCGNFIAMRLTNPDDQNVIRRLFPDSLEGFADILPTLDIGECLVVGDASLLPSRVQVDEPTVKPISATVDVWTEWGIKKTSNAIADSVQVLRQQGTES